MALLHTVPDGDTDMADGALMWDSVLDSDTEVFTLLITHITITNTTHIIMTIQLTTEAEEILPLLIEMMTEGEAPTLEVSGKLEIPDLQIMELPE